MANKIIIGNLKSDMTIYEVNNYLKQIENKLNSNVVLCPSSIYIPYFLNNKFNIGIQNICYDMNMSITGEILAHQAFNMGVKYCILGHSDRRIHFYENDITINKKLISALNNNLKVVLCIGETKEQLEMLKKDITLKKQIKNSIKDIPVNKIDNLYIAYEPVWAIGTNTVPNLMEIEKTISYIKNIFYDLTGYKVKVLYGGSVDDKNIYQLKSLENLDGFLIGKASLDPNKFLKIVEVVVPQ